MHAGFAPALAAPQHGGKYGDTRRRIQHRRDSKPEDIHAPSPYRPIRQYTVIHITRNPLLTDKEKKVPF